MSLKVVLYVLTAIVAFVFAFWEERLKREMTRGVPERQSAVSDIGVLDDLAKRIERERFLTNLPKATRSKLRLFAILRFSAIGLLIIEVLLLQR